jgi:hypothetical protein
LTIPLILLPAITETHPRSNSWWIHPVLAMPDKTPATMPDGMAMPSLETKGRQLPSYVSRQNSFHNAKWHALMPIPSLETKGRQRHSYVIFWTKLRCPIQRYQQLIIPLGPGTEQLNIFSLKKISRRSLHVLGVAKWK